MYDPTEDKETENGSGDKGPTGFTGGTDRATGEYHYKNGYTQRIYSDAHYVPVDDTTTPPHYYERQEKPPKAEPKPRKVRTVRPGKNHTAGIILACAVCAAAGGLIGAGIVSGRMEGRLTALETGLQTVNESVRTVSAGSADSREAEAESSPALPMTISEETGSAEAPADIYAMACQQVVGITTEVTYTNYFGQDSSSAVTGTGFFITDDGYILTNYHVIEYAYEYGYGVTVMLHDGTRYDAAIIGVEESNDIAVLKIDAGTVTPVTLADSSNLQVGDDVYAVGNPLGELEFSMSFGHVSALDRLISTDTTDGAINMFQIDAAVNSGNSGGPVYDQYGKVVGIVTAKYSDTGVEGLGFAIPVNDAAEIANDLITVGYVTGKASLGVSFDQRYTSVYSQYYGLPQGAYVAAVDSGSCAAAAGILPGDIITAIGGTEVSSYTDAKNAIRGYAAGDTTDITLYRSGSTETVTLTFDEDVPTAGTGGSYTGTGNYYAAG